MNTKSLAAAFGAAAILLLLSSSIATAQVTIYDDDDNANNPGSWTDNLNWYNVPTLSPTQGPVQIGTGAEVEIGTVPSAASGGGVIVDTPGQAEIASLTFNSTLGSSVQVTGLGADQSLLVDDSITNASTSNQIIALPLYIGGTNVTVAGGTAGLTIGQLTLGTSTFAATSIQTSGNVTLSGSTILDINSTAAGGFSKINISSGTLNASGTSIFLQGNQNYTGTAGDFFQIVNITSPGTLNVTNATVNSSGLTAFTSAGILAFVPTLLQKGILFVEPLAGGTIINTGVVLPIDKDSEFNPNGTITTVTLNGGELLTDNSETGAPTPFSTTRNVLINTVATAGSTGGTIAANASTVATYTGVVSDQTVNSFTNSGTLVLGDSARSGTGTVVFAGANTYAGATDVTAGTLEAGIQSVAGVSGAFGNNSAVTVGASGTLDLGGFNTQIGSLTGNGHVTNSGTSAAILSVGGDNTSPAAFSGVIANGAHTTGLTKIGTGTLILSGVNTFTGGVNLNAGVVQAASTTSGDSLGSSGNIDFGGGTLQLTSSDHADYSSRIASGTSASAVAIDVNGQSTTFATGLTGNQSGGLTLTDSTGGGTLTLNAANAYTGTTTVTSGTLAIGASGSLTGSTNVAVNSGAFMTVASTGSILATTALTDNGTVTLNKAAATIATLNGTNTGLVKLNTTNLTVSGGGTFAGGIQDGASAGALTVSGGTLTLNGANNSYTGTTTVSGGTLVVGATGALTGSTAVTVNSGALTVNSGGSILATTALTDDGTTTLNNATTTIASLNGTSGGLLKLNTTNLTVTGGGTFAGAIQNGTNAGALTVTGGTLTLNGANSYTGNTLVNGGTLAIGATGSLTGSTTVTVTTGALTVASGGSILATTALTDNGAVTFNNAAQTLASLNGTGSTLALNGGSTALTVSGGGTFGGAISGTGGTLAVSGGTLTLNGANSYTGATTVSGGTLVIGATGSLTGSTAVTVNSGALTVASGGSILATTALTDDGTTTFNNATTTIASLNGTSGGLVKLNTTNLTVSNGGTFAGGIQDGASAGALTVSGGTLTLNGANNSYTGTTTVSGGTLVVGATGALTGSTAVTVNSGALTVASGGSILATTALTDDGTTTFNNATTTIASLNGTSGGLVKLNTTNLTVSGGGTFAGGIQNGASAGALTVSGGTLTLNGANNSYTGTTTVSGGTLVVGATGALTGSTAVTVNSGALTVASGGSILATTALTDDGTTTLNNATTTIASLNGTSGGLLKLNTTNLTVTGGGTFAGAIQNGTNAGALTVTGGTLTLNGANSYTGNTLVNGGTLAVGATGSLTGSTNVTVTTGALTVASGGSILATTALTDNAAVTFNNASQTLASLNGATGSLTLNTTNLTLSGGSSFAGVIQNGASAGQLTLSGGTDTLSGANTYSGGTSVTAGTLVVANTTGSATGTGAVTLSSGADLEGTTTGADISGLVTLNGNNTVSSTVGTLSTGNISVNNANNIISMGTVGALSTITTLNGAATLAINGTSTLNGSLNVGAGTLTGTGTTGAVTVGSGGIVNAGGIGTMGTLHVGTITFNSGSNFDLDMSGASTDLLTVTGTSTGALTIGNGAKLTFNIGSSLTQTSYVLADVTGTNGTLSGTFTSGNIINLPTGYQLVYTGTELELVESTPSTQSLAGPTPSPINIIAGASTTVSSTLTNTGTSALNVSLSGANSDGTIGTFTSSSGATVAPNNGTSTVGATLTAGTAGLGNTYTLSNTDSNATPTTATSPSGTLNVYNHSAPSLGTNPGTIGTVITGATVTSQTTLNNGAGINAGLQIVNLGGLTTTGPNVIAAGSSDTLTATGTAGAAGAYNQTYTIQTEDDQTITGATSNTNITYTVNGTVLNHSNGALGIASGNNQTVIVGATTATATLNLTNAGAQNASMLVNSLGAGVSGPTTSVAAGGSQSYTATLNASTVGASQQQTFSITVQDAALPGQGSAYNVTSGDVTLNVLGHSSGSLSSTGSNFGTVITGATVANQTTDLQNAAGYIAGLQIVNLGGLTTSGPNVIAAGSSDTLSATVSTSTAGAYSQTYTIQTSDDQSLLGATANTNLTYTVTGDILNHSNGALGIASGNDQTVIVGAAGVTATLDLTNAGANNAALMVNSLTGGVTGPTTPVAANGSQSYTAALSTSTAGAAQQQTFSINVQDAALPGQGAAYSVMSPAVTLNVLGHSSVSLSSGSDNFGTVHENASVASQTTNLQNAAGYLAGLQIVNLGGLTTSGPNVIAAGSSDTLDATVNTGTAGAYSQSYTIQTSDDQSLLGHTNNTNQTFTVTGTIYSGQSVWAGTSTGGSWGTLATAFGTNWGATQGSPGLDPNFATTDTATFDNVTAQSTQLVTLDGASPSLNSITFDSPNTSYTLDQGTGGTLTLNNGGGTALLTNTAGNNTINANTGLTLASNVSVVDTAGTLTLAGNISGNGTGLTLSGGGTVVLSGTDTYTGATNLQSGTLMFGSDNTIAASSVVTVSGGTINLNGHAQTLNNFSSTGGILTNTGAPITVTLYEAVDPINASQITGNIAIDKTGPGLLVLTNPNNDYNGGTTISSGTLEVGSAMALGTNFVNNVGGTLGTYGAQHVINVATSYTQSSAGTLVINLNSLPTANPGVTDTNDVLSVNGTATLGGKLDVSFVNHFMPVKGQQFVVVETTGGIDPISLSTGFTDPTILTPFGVEASGTLTDANDDLTLTVTSTQLALSGTLGNFYTPNRAAIATYLSSPNLPTSDPVLYQAIVNVLTNSGQEALPQTVAEITDQFNPEAFANFNRSTVFNNAVFSTQMLDSYLETGRSSTGDFLAATGQIDSSALTVVGSDVDPSLAQVSSQLLAWTPAPIAHGLLSDTTDPVVTGVDSKDMKVTSAAANSPNFNVFVAGNVVLAQNFSQADLAHSDSTTGAVQIGGDYRITPHLRAGVLFGYQHTDASLDNNGSKATIDSYAPGAYVSFADNGWYANALGSYGFNSFTEDRAVSIGGMSAFARGAPSGDQIAGDLDGGYDFHFNNLTMGPLAGVQYTHLDVDSFSEDGAETLGSDLNVGKQQADSLRSRLGGHLSYVFQTGTVLLTPHLDASWQHEFMDQGQGINAQIVNVVGGPFTVKTPNPSRDSALLDCGLNAQFNGQVSVFGDYLVQAGQSNYFGQSVQAGVKIGF
jgi:fibronectin-binding autotransporter adhesin